MSLFTKVILLLVCCLLVVSLSEAREIKEIIIHTTDAPRSCGAKCIDAIHRQQGWESCGYHYLINEDGTVSKCRHESNVGAHTKFYNENSIGIAWLGKKDDLTKEQYKSLILLAKILAVRYNIPVDSIKGHKEYYTSFGKTCPRLDMDKFRKEVNQLELK